jgi:hypothetical protein
MSFYSKNWPQETAELEPFLLVLTLGRNVRLGCESKVCEREREDN